MVFIYIILLFIIGLIFASKTLENIEKFAGFFLVFILAIGFFVSSIFIEEKGKVTVLRALGYREYTKNELYIMSNMQKDQLPKTFDLVKGTIYWKIDEQNIK